jgi:hypothetical protein
MDVFCGGCMAQSREVSSRQRVISVIAWLEADGAALMIGEYVEKLGWCAFWR